jgi:exopolysaccharide biosynthesis operon protein EpsL
LKARCARVVLFGAAVSTLGAAWSPGAWADAEDTVNATVGYAHQTDSNLFRLSDAVDPLSVLGTPRKSDSIDVTSAALSVDKTYSLQRFQLSGSLVNYHYQRFGYLSFNAFNYNAAWNWSLTPRVRGTLSADRNQVLNSFADFRSYALRNVRTDKNLRFDVEADLGAAVRLLGAIDHVRRTNEVPGVLDGDREAQGAAFGIRYIFPSGSTATYRYRQGSGESNSGQDLFSALTGRFDDRLHQVELSWLVSGKTKVNAHLGHLQRSYPGASQRDFGGPVGDVGMEWDVTGKVKLNAMLQRDLANYQTDTTSYVKIDRITFTPKYEATARITVLGNFEHAIRNFGGSPLAGVYGDRRDVFDFASFGVQWRPIRAATIALMLQRIRNTSNLLGFDYVSNGVNLSGKFSF